MAGRSAPSWLTDELVATGEAVAYLALSGNFAVAVTPAALGSTVE